MKLRYEAQHGLANGVHVQPVSPLLMNLENSLFDLPTPTAVMD
jgi:hypothetical protein